MNSASIKLSSNSALLQFSPNRNGEYHIFLSFLNNKARDTFDKCEFFWLKDAKNLAECKNELIYKKITLWINKKIIQGQYKYHDWGNAYVYSFNNIGTNIHPSLKLTKLDLEKNKLVTIKVFIDASQIDILKDQPVLTIEPDPAFYYGRVYVGIFLLIISIPIIISIIFLVIMLKNKK